jgi:hypothetical protein
VAEYTSPAWGPVSGSATTTHDVADEWFICNVWTFRQYRDSDLDRVDLPWNVEQHKFNSQTGELVPGTGIWCATVATEQLARQIAEMLADDDS